MTVKSPWEYCADSWKNLCREYKEKSCRTRQFAHVLKVIQDSVQSLTGFRISWSEVRIQKPAFRILQARIFRIPESGLPYMGRNRTESVENIGFILELYKRCMATL